MSVYLDNAATTNINPDVLAVIIKTLSTNYGNPSSTHKIGRQAKVLVETARKKIAQILNIQPVEIVFTASGTEANNLIIRSCVANLGVRTIISSPIEHKCVTETIKSLALQYPDLRIMMVNLNQNGTIDYDNLEDLLINAQSPTLVSLMHGNNELANLLDLEKTAILCHQNKAYFHSDTIQTIAHYNLNLNSNDSPDFISCSAHKFHGPKGVGFAYIKKSIALKAIITGGLQERNMRAGTENVAGIVALALALTIAKEDLAEKNKYISSIKQYCINELLKWQPLITFNGESGSINSLFTILSVSLPFKNDMISFLLDLKEIAVSQGSACSSGATKTSEILTLIQTQEQIAKNTTLRLSFSMETSRKDIDTLISNLMIIFPYK